MEYSDKKVRWASGQAATLAEHISQGPLSAACALQFAAEIANSLCTLHEEGRLHGSVNADSVVVAGAGVELLPSAEPAPYTVAGGDISAFGALLYEMLTGSKISADSTPALAAPTPRNSEDRIRAAAIRLASKCLRSTSTSFSEMQNVLTEVRLLSLQAKIREKPAAAAPEIALPQPVRQVLFPLKTQAPASGLGHVGTVQRNYTPVPADSFMAKTVAETSDPAPSGVKCPACGVPYVYPSRSRTWFEIALAAWGVPPLRCHRCLHRYVVVLKWFNFSKGSPINASRSSPS